MAEPTDKPFVKVNQSSKCVHNSKIIIGANEFKNGAENNTLQPTVATNIAMNVNSAIFTATTNMSIAATNELVVEKNVTQQPSNSATANNYAENQAEVKAYVATHSIIPTATAAAVAISEQNACVTTAQCSTCIPTSYSTNNTTQKPIFNDFYNRYQNAANADNATYKSLSLCTSSVVQAMEMISGYNSSINATCSSDYVPQAASVNDNIPTRTGKVLNKRKTAVRRRKRAFHIQRSHANARQLVPPPPQALVNVAESLADLHICAKALASATNSMHTVVDSENAADRSTTANSDTQFTTALDYNAFTALQMNCSSAQNAGISCSTAVQVGIGASETVCNVCNLSDDSDIRPLSPNMAANVDALIKDFAKLSISSMVEISTTVNQTLTKCPEHINEMCSIEACDAANKYFEMEATLAKLTENVSEMQLTEANQYVELELSVNVSGIGSTEAYDVGDQNKEFESTDNVSENNSNEAFSVANQKKELETNEYVSEENSNEAYGAANQKKELETNEYVSEKNSNEAYGEANQNKELETNEYLSGENSNEAYGEANQYKKLKKNEYMSGENSNEAYSAVNHNKELETNEYVSEENSNKACAATYYSEELKSADNVRGKNSSESYGVANQNKELETNECVSEKNSSEAYGVANQNKDLETNEYLSGKNSNAAYLVGDQNKELKTNEYLSGENSNEAYGVANQNKELETNEYLSEENSNEAYGVVNHNKELESNEYVSEKNSNEANDATYYSEELKSADNLSEENSNEAYGAANQNKELETNEYVRELKSADNVSEIKPTIKKWIENVYEIDIMQKNRAVLVATYQNHLAENKQKIAKISATAKDIKLQQKIFQNELAAVAAQHEDIMSNIEDFEKLLNDYITSSTYENANNVQSLLIETNRDLHTMLETIKQNKIYMQNRSSFNKIEKIFDEQTKSMEYIETHISDIINTLQKQPETQNEAKKPNQ